MFTPAIETGILPGTTRAFMIELARSMGIDVYEGFYGKEDVEGADELFVTNAVQETCPAIGNRRDPTSGGFGGLL